MIINFIFKVVSNSMFPLMRINDLIVVKKTAFDLLKINDIISIIDNDKVIVHRIIAKSGLELITKGDNNKDIDNSSLSKERYFGRVKYILHNNIIKDINTGTKTVLLKANNKYYCIIDNTIITFYHDFTLCKSKYLENVSVSSVTYYKDQFTC